jgi:DNA segregation ATPase FtsK/SpoIIIE-like protein
VSKEGFTRQEVLKPSLPQDQKQVPNPGDIERAPQSRPPMWVLVVIFVVALVVLLVVLYRSGARQMSTGSLFIAPVMVVSGLMMLRTRGGGDRKNRPAAVNHRRASYLRVLDELRGDLHKSAAAQAREIAYRHPDPANGSLTTLIGSGRMWECSPRDHTFGHLRLGVGMQRLKSVLIPPEKVPPPEHRETVTAMAARDFLLTQNVVHDVARPLHLFDQPGWCFFAEPAQRATVQGVLRALVCQLCVFHGPDDVRVAVITDDLQAWEWCKWLPHTGDEQFIDASGQARLLFADVDAFVERFGPELAERSAWAPQVTGVSQPDGWMVVVVDYPGAQVGHILGGGGYAGVSVLEATGDDNSILATSATAFQVDDSGNLLKAEEQR